MGIYITFVYDLLRIFRRVVRHGSFLLSLEDLAFWIYCGMEVFLLMYRESNGAMRWFSVLGAGAGIFAYKKLISPLLVKYVSLALNRILKLILKGLRLAGRPFAFFGRKFGKSCRGAAGGLRRRTGKWKRAVKNRLTVSLKVFKMNLKK